MKVFCQRQNRPRGAQGLGPRSRREEHIVQPAHRETLALVGESGCGKSTTGRSILKLIEPDSGTILVDGEDVLGANPRTLRELRKRMQIVFQEPFASLIFPVYDRKPPCDQPRSHRCGCPLSSDSSLRIWVASSAGLPVSRHENVSDEERRRYAERRRITSAPLRRVRIEA